MLSRHNGTLTVSDRLLVGYLLLVLISLSVAVAREQILVAIVPLIPLLIGFILRFPNYLYLLLFALIPFSMDVYLPGGLGTDLPTEPMMWALFGLGLVYVLHYQNKMDFRFFTNTGTILLLMGYGWMWVATVFAEYPLFALKFSLAKSWYIFVFFFFLLVFTKQVSFHDRIIKVLGISTGLVVLFVLVKHSQSGFDFAEAQFAVQPFFSNNVYYAVMLISLAPLIWAQWSIHPKKTLFAFIFILLIIGILLSYKRVALVAGMAAIVWAYVIRWRLVKPAIIVGFIVGIGVISFFVRQERFLDFAPRYEQTISHYEFDDLLSATYKGQDISTMERVYRWVAGYYMFQERPLTGFGPTNFYPVYQRYTITPFKTYVSDNPEKSGMHNYLFMLSVEQGLPGVFLFLILVVHLLLITQKAYHLTDDPSTRKRVLGWGLCIFIVFMTSLMNEVLESDKIGPLFYLSSALLIYHHQKIRLSDLKISKPV